MAERGQLGRGSDALVAQLSDLLCIDRQTVEIYRVAIAGLSNPALRTVAEHYRDDHERHIDELTRLVRAFGGGRPSAGVLPLPEPGSAALAGDRAILCTLKDSERRGRDAYRAAAREDLPPEVAAVLRRAANDEATHYAWALEMLDDLESGRQELGQARIAGFIRRAERRTTAAVVHARSEMVSQVDDHPLRVTLLAIALGLCAGALIGRREARR